MTIDIYGGMKPLEVLLNECVVKIDYVEIEGNDCNFFLTLSAITMSNFLFF